MEKRPFTFHLSNDFLAPQKGRNEKKQNKPIKPSLSNPTPPPPFFLFFYLSIYLFVLNFFVIWVLTSWFDCQPRPPPRRRRRTKALRRSCAGSTACPRQSSPCGCHKAFHHKHQRICKHVVLKSLVAGKFFFFFFSKETDGDESPLSRRVSGCLCN